MDLADGPLRSASDREQAALALATPEKALMFSRRGPRLVLSILALDLTMAACASLSTIRDPDELARTWQSARVWIPGALPGAWPRSLSIGDLARAVAELPAGTRFPAVLYMHGCDGLPSDSHPWAVTLVNAGYAMVAPDSFARKYRPVTCDPSTSTATYSPDAYAMREAEMEYAATQIRTLPWVDPGNVFVLGTSEGGLAIATTVGRSFKGYIVTAWTCRQDYHTEMQGLWVPMDKPVLAIVYADDPWFPNPGQRGHCGERFGSRKGSRSIVLPGRGHSVARAPDARSAVLDFLRQYTTQRPDALAPVQR